jgi:prepilin-type N-terminal cleavage/methylation domain-containing protein
VATPSGFRAGASNGVQPLIARWPFRRAASSASDSGYTLIELLVVIVTLGILAAVVVFGITGVTAQSEQATCTSDAKAVAIALGAYEEEHPQIVQITQAQLVAFGTGTLQTWPLGPQGTFSVEIAGDGNTLVGQLDAAGNHISDNDVIVQIGASVYDATADLQQACSTV